MSVRRSTYFSVASRNAGMGINFVASVVIARLLSPAEIGVFAVSAAFIMISQVIRDSGIGSYLIQERDLTRERIRAAMGVSLVVGALLGAAIVGMASPLSRFYSEPGVEKVLYILAFSFVLAPVNSVGLALLRRELSFGVAFFLETSSNAVWASSAVALAYAGFSYYSMAWASIASTAALCLMFLACRPRMILIRPSLSGWRKVFGFSSMVTLTQMITQVGVLAPALVLGRIGDFSAVAFYNRGNSLTKMFRDTVERGAAIVALPAFSAKARQGTLDAASYCQATSLITGISWPFFAVLAIMAYPIVRILFGPQWDAAVPVVQLLAISNIIRSQEVFAAQLTIAHGAVRIMLLREVIVQGLRVTVIVACAFHGFVAVAAGQVAVTILTLGTNQIILRRLIGLSARDRIRSCARSFVVAVATAVGPGAVAAFMPASPGFLWPPLLLALGTGTAGWLAAALLIAHPLRGELLLLMRKAGSVLAPLTSRPPARRKEGSA